MCGIGGYFSREGLRADEAEPLLDALQRALRHRGPDGEGRFRAPHAGLISTRLAIVDPAGGHMPVHDQARDLVSVLNGELYGYRDLARALRDEGEPLAHDGDSALLNPLYARHGLGLVDHLPGMFAIALWDGRTPRLLLARDRMGMKPLYLARPRPGLVLFASEAKALLATGLVPPRLEPEALRDLFSAGYPVPPRSMFQGIEALPPAHLLVLDLDRETTPRPYFVPPYSGAPEPAKPTLVAPLAETLARAVREHLVADVEVGSYLSGGLDSGAIAALAQRESRGHIRTFSMTFPEALRFDEAAEARATAEAIGSTHTELPQSPIEAADYAATLRAMEAPQVHTVAFCLWRLARAVRAAGLKVTLSGEGSDEVFAGYGVFKLGKLRRSPLGRWPWLRRAVTGLALGRKEPQLNARLNTWWGAEPQLIERFGVLPPWIEQWWILAESTRKLMTPSLEDRLGDAPLPQLTGPTPWRTLDAPLHRDLLFEQRTRLDGWVLPLGDRLSMAHGLELRVPFLDTQVVEQTALLTPRELMPALREKQALRNALRGVLPEALRTRRKRAFVAPSADWFFGPTPPEFVREALSADTVRARGLFDPVAIEAAQARLAADARGFEKLTLTWGLQVALSTEVFCREFGASLG